MTGPTLYRSRRPARWAWAGLLAWASLISAAAADGPPTTLDQAAAEFDRVARPLVGRYCLDCHATDAMEGDLDLERFATLAEVRKGQAVWLKVKEMLDSRQMPPSQGRRMPAADRRALSDWLTRYLRAEALADAGDPGPVVLRRLSNAQYTHVVRDLTGLPLDPAREFPADGAAGEGFTNTGDALVMSPALLSKYFDAAKAIAAHAVPLPDGLRFSAATTRRDWTNETVDQIRRLYAEFTDDWGASRVNLQGIVFDTNAGGRLPLERYLAATIEDRETLAKGEKALAEVARRRSLSPKYLGVLWTAMNDPGPSPLLDDLRARWKTAQPGDAKALAESVAAWQAALWKFNSVGHIGKVGGPKSWMEPVSPVATSQEFRLKLPPAPSGKDLRVYLAADLAERPGGSAAVVWGAPRLVAPGMPDLPLRDLRAVSSALSTLRARIFGATAPSLAAAAEAGQSRGRFDPDALARKHGVAPDVLAAWFDYLGLGTGDGSVTVRSHLSGQAVKVAGHEFVNGWGPGETPNMLANASDTHVRVPGNLRPHSVAMHPSPTLRVAAGWLSPVSGVAAVEAKVQHAHPECGNGVTWSVEVRRGSVRQRLAAGVAQGGGVVAAGPFPSVPVRPGDLVSVVVGPRDGNHACDLTAVDLTVKVGESTWDLAADVSPDVLAGNPHADRQGHPAVWHFYTEPDRGGDSDSVLPAGSVLARWESEADPARKAVLAREAQAVLVAGPPAAAESPDAALYRQLVSLRGPLLRAARRAGDRAGAAAPYGAATFGHVPGGGEIGADDLGARAPAVVEVTVPAGLAEGCELVTTARPDASASDAAVQFAVTTARPVPRTRPDPARPIVVTGEGRARARLERAFDAFRGLFPPALCYTKIVPVDEVITLSLFYREDDHLRRLMLDDAQTARLDRLWHELRFISQDALTLVDAFQQLLEYASQDGDPKAFEPLRQPILDRAEAFRKRLAEAGPRQVEALIDLATQVYRRPLRPGEADELRGLYRKLRDEGLPHDDAWRLLLARLLVSPAFLYRVEVAPPGAASAPVSGWELASRLSFFLWSSSPDETLRRLAASGRLSDPDVLAAQARRMLADEKVRRLAVEFACQWLHVYEFDTLDEKSDQVFPEFKSLRGPMYEETIRFFTDAYRRDLPAISFLDADFTVLNEAMARCYGVPWPGGEGWRRVEGARTFGRGGILGLATTLAKQSGASRTSPILRGTWVSEVLLGEKLPKPPPGTPQLPEDESSTGGLSVRQLVERHSRDPKCIRCHLLVDPMGFTLEGFDAIGRRRAKDLGDHAVDTRATLPDGRAIDGLDGLRTYLLTTRRADVCRQFSRKLLGYALGRGVRLTDGPLIDELAGKVSAGSSFGDVVEAIVRGRQFREVRGRDAAAVTVTHSGQPVSGPDR